MPQTPGQSIAPRSLEQQVDIETPEQVVISYTVAGVGSRAAAALIDYFIFAVIVFGFVVVLNLLSSVVHLGGGSKRFQEASGAVFLAILLTAGFGLFWGYYVLFEALWDGQTPGKRYMGLRVVRDGGYSITFAASATRNLVRAIDFQPGMTYGVGMLSVIFSSAGKRLGDYAAGTIVVRERQVSAPSTAVLEASGQSAAVQQQWKRWREFAQLLAHAQQRRLRNLSESEVSEFVARYRELANDLARLQGARGNAKQPKVQDLDTVFYLSRLVAGGHNLLYRDRRMTMRSVWNTFTYSIPREIRRSALPIGISAVLLFGPAVIAYTAVVRSPSVAKQILPAEMIDRADYGVERAKAHTGYIPDPELLRPVMSSAIINNNVQVAFVAFAGGMLAGVATVLALVTNGISFGAVLGLYETKGILALILSFVAPHGVLELTAICIAGGAGLLLAAGMLIPGARTRREAFRENGRRAIRLVGAAILLLIVAGTLEGMVSPIPSWSLGEKGAVSAATAILLVLYINLNRGRVPPVEDADIYSST